MDAIRSGHLRHCPHHHQRSYGDHQIGSFAGFQHLTQWLGHEAFSAIGTVIGAHYEFTGKLPEVILHDQKILCPGTDNNGNMAAPTRQFLNLRIHTRGSYSAAYAHNLNLTFRQFCGIAQGTHEVQYSVAGAQIRKLRRSFACNLNNNSYSARFRVTIFYCQWYSLPAFVHP